jgi:hypothetical protein
MLGIAFFIVVLSIRIMSVVVLIVIMMSDVAPMKRSKVSTINMITIVNDNSSSVI